MSYFDQSYSYNSVNEVFMSANRRGKIPKEYLSEEYLSTAKEYREIRIELNRIKKKKTAERTEAEKDRIQSLVSLMKENANKQKDLLKLHLTNVAHKIASKDFRFNLTADDILDPDKPIYKIDKTPEQYFAMQVLCYNLKHLFRIKMHGRTEILNQLNLLLSEDKSPKYVIRTDVIHCFESIPHDKLFEMIDDNSLLDARNKMMLKGLINGEFEKKNLRRMVKTRDCGIPRGCAVSSILAEFYLSKVDNEIRNKFSEIIYMARYVDDIIIIIHPNAASSQRDGIQSYVDLIAEKYENYGISIHNDGKEDGEKFKLVDTFVSRDFVLPLLGYKINVNSNKVIFNLKSQKIKKIHERINSSVMHFNELILTKGYDCAVKYLYDALHVLTCNTNLYNVKKSVKVGMYYSNRLLNNYAVLKKLDYFLKIEISKLELPLSHYKDKDERDKQKKKLIAKILNVISFERGFNQRKRYKFKRNRLQEINYSWA